MWVWVPVMTLVSLSKILYYNCFSSPRGRVAVDIVCEKALEAYGCPGCILPREPRRIKGMSSALNL